MFEARLKKVKNHLKNKKIDTVLVSDVSNIIYLTGFTNFSDKEREAYLLIGEDFQYIITDGRYTQSVKAQVKYFDLFERSSKKPTTKLFQLLKKKIKKLGIEEDNLTVSEHKLLAKYFPNILHVDFKKHRAIKNNEEINKIKTACQLGDLAFEYILKKIKAGASEKEIAYHLEFFVKGKGGEFSFPAIVAFGKNSSIPHHQTGNDVLGPETSSGREGQFVLLDFGVKIDNYCSDMTRTVFFGKPSKKQQRIYETVLKTQQKAVDFINKGLKNGKKIKLAAVDKVARDFIISQGYPPIPHSLGHGIGLEVHEHPSLSPKSKDILKEGMVFSIEPGVYLPGFGAVRIEDLFACKTGSIKKLTKAQSKLITI